MNDGPLLSSSGERPNIPSRVLSPIYEVIFKNLKSETHSPVDKRQTLSPVFNPVSDADP